VDSQAIAQVRRFNRTVTQRVGALNEAYLSRDRPLGQARLLWEIGLEGDDVRSLRSRLDVDSGYLSRLLRSLETAGLVVVGASDSDARVRTARLTKAGRSEWALLDQGSDDLAASILMPLGARQRTRLVAAMAEVEQLLVASMVDVRVCDPRHPHARFCVQAYFSELSRRFAAGFDPALSLSADDAELTLPAGLLLVATLHSEPVGCAALKLHRRAPGEIKRMWVDPDVRGLGLGRRLLTEAEAHAAAHGVRTLRLETNRALDEAIGLYRAAGYREVAAFNDERYADHWFEKSLAGRVDRAVTAGGARPGRRGPARPRRRASR
jgi:DNA-binding MarR family transcriptional regulator/GNAT superfamily N-acetyltransferase